MSGSEDTPNVDAIMRDIRARVARGVAAHPVSLVEEPPPYGWSANDEAVVRDGWDVYHIELQSPRGGVLGSLLTRLKQATRRLLAPVLGKQIAFNHAIADFVLDLRERTSLMIVHQAHVREAQERIRAELSDSVVELRAQVARLASRIDAVDARGTAVSRDAGPGGRGAYVAYFAGCTAVLDLAAGRGDFLAGLADAGGAGRGVANDPQDARICRARGLDVEVADCIEALHGVPEGTLDGIFCSDLADRLPLTRMTTLLPQCRRALAAHAPLVLAAHVATPPTIWRALLEHAGFVDVCIADDAVSARAPDRAVVGRHAPAAPTT